MPAPSRRPSEQSILRGLVVLFFTLGVAATGAGVMFGGSANAVQSAFLAIGAAMFFGFFFVTVGVYGLGWLLRKNQLWRQARRRQV